MALSFTKLTKNKICKFTFFWMYFLLLMFHFGLCNLQWESYNNGNLEGWKREREERYYEFKRSLDCIFPYKKSYVTIQINYTATKLDRDTYPICSCTLSLEIKCSQQLLEFPKFQKPFIKNVQLRNSWQQNELEKIKNNEDNLLKNLVFRVLHVSKQSISSLGLKAFYPLKFASILSNHNNIGDLVHEGALVGQGKSLRELHLGDCRLKLLPEKLLTGLVALEKLYLWGNDVSKFPNGFFKEASNLKELYLWGNRIEELKGHTLAGLWNLKRLELDKNLISKLDKKHFRHLIALEILNLSHNRIHTVYGNTFSFMTHLKMLSLQNNHIVFMYSEAFNNLNNLMILNLEGNFINFMPDHLFNKLQNLTSLTLSHNSLDQLKSNTFAGLQTLHELKLSSNNISFLPDKLFKTCTNLSVLLLDQNKLTFLSKSTFAKSTHFRYLSILSNPLECTCKIQWLKNICMPKISNFSHVSIQSGRFPLFRSPSLAATCFDESFPDSLVYNACMIPKQDCQHHRKKLQRSIDQQQVEKYFLQKT